MTDKRKTIIDRIKKNGGFWSYSEPPYGLDDDSVIEAGLIYLELEEMHFLFECWKYSRIKRIWKERLLKQGDRMNILNFILAVKVFNIKRPEQYIKKYSQTR